MRSIGNHSVQTPKQHRTLDVVDNISTKVKRIASNAEEISNDFEKIDANISQEEYYKLHAFGANDVKMQEWKNSTPRSRPHLPLKLSLFCLVYHIW